MTFSADVQKGIIAGAFGLIGTLIPAALAWSRDRSTAAARLQTIDEAAKRLTFWEQWLKLSAQVSQPSDPSATLRLKQELDLLSDLIQRDSFIKHAQASKQQGRSTEFQAKVNDLPLVRRLLLLYMPSRSTAWFPRIFFFVGLVCALLIPAGMAANPDPLSLRDVAIAEFFFFIWLFVFRSLSHWLEQPGNTSPISHATANLAASATPPLPPSSNPT